MTELLVGTKKGLFVLEGAAGRRVRGDRARVRGRARRVRDARPRLGPHPGRGHLRLLRAEAALRRGRERASGTRTGVALPEGGGQALERLWVIVAGEDGRLYMGGDPGVLFESADGGASWSLVRSLWEHPTRPGLAAGRRRAVPALDRAVAGRAGAARARDVRRRRVADRRRHARRGGTATRASSRATCPTTPSRA